MTMPNWFRGLWWAALLAGTTVYLLARWQFVLVGAEPKADTIIFCIWVALALLPLLSEISLLGFSLKKDFERLEKDLESRMEMLQFAIQSSASSAAQINSNVTFGAPKSDAQLAEAEPAIRAIVQREMRTYGVSPSDPKSEFKTGDTEQFLFSVRHHLEKQVRRIYRENVSEDLSDPKHRYTSVISLSRVLASREVIHGQLANAIVEVYRACSTAIHGEDVTETQVKFVRDIAPDMLATLRAI